MHRMQMSIRRYALAGPVAVLAGVLAAAGCANPNATAPSSQTMTEALTAQASPKPAGQSGKPEAAGRPAADSRQAGAAVATVNSRPVAYNEWLNLLKRSHGLSAFQQILAVELARQAAEAKGIALSQSQLNEAYGQELAEVAGPDAKTPAEQERIVQAILARRNISMDEFRLSAYRNAYLRRIVEPIVERSITDEALQVEFDRLYGEKVQVRHIQLSEANTVHKVLQALEDGMEFTEAVRQFSQNLDSAAEGGLLQPFSKADPVVPPAVREVAFATAVGKVAGPVRAEGWSQIVKVEARFPASPIEYSSVADQVRRSLKEQMVRQQMQQLLQNMLQSAVIRVHDPELNKQFEALKADKP